MIEQTIDILIADNTISLKAKGLYFTLLLTHEDESQSIDSISNYTKESKGAISSALNELILHTYIKKERLSNAKVKYNLIYKPF
jgi:predicted transcriptional regulator